MTKVSDAPLVYVEVDVTGADDIGEWVGVLECAVDTRDGTVLVLDDVSGTYTRHHGLSALAQDRARVAAAAELGG